MNEKTENRITIVSDLGLASLLTTLGYEPIGLQRLNPKRVGILFSKNKKIEEAIQDYWNNANISVPIQTLFRNQRSLKDRIYSTQ